MLDNPRSDRIRKVAALSGRSARKKTGRVLVEGPQSVQELVKFRPGSITDVYLTEKFTQDHADLAGEISQAVRFVHQVSLPVMAKISGESQGVVAVAHNWAIGDQEESLQEVVAGLGRGSSQFLVVLPETQDPGNLGTIIRTSVAMGASAILLGVGTVEPGNPKVIRSSAGSVFQLPILHVDFDRAAQVLRKFDVPLLGTFLRSDTVSLPELIAADTLKEPHAWVFGNEARGLSPQEADACATLVRIPMAGGVDSLNVAASAAICTFASSLAR